MTGEEVEEEDVTGEDVAGEGAAGEDVPGADVTCENEEEAFNKRRKPPRILKSTII